jgi:hypothetical protein
MHRACVMQQRLQRKSFSAFSAEKIGVKSAPAAKKKSKKN